MNLTQMVDKAKGVPEAFKIGYDAVMGGNPRAALSTYGDDYRMAGRVVVPPKVYDELTKDFGELRLILFDLGAEMSLRKVHSNMQKKRHIPSLNYQE